MNLDEDTLERLLRHAPSPQPPRHLKDRLVADIALPACDSQGLAPNGASLRRPGLWEWLRVWWPTAATASLTLAACGALTYQQQQISKLRKQVEAIERTPATRTQGVEPTPVPTSHEAFRSSGENLESLRQTVAKLTAEVARLEALAAENEQLRQAVASTSGLSAAEVEEVKAQEEAALSIRCINHLKQLGLCVRVWANDNEDMLPPDILSMTNEMSTPKILLCPADTRRQAPPGWATWSAANCSYEHLATSGPATEPQRVMFRCPIHGHVTLCDGSVQARVAIEHPEWLVTRDGKLYLEH